MRTISLESEQQALQRTMASSYCPAPIKQARERQDEMLVQRLRQGLYNMADIGCGNGYHAVLLASATRVYHGFEISPDMAEAARALWRKEQIDNARIFVGDVAAATVEADFYDVVLCLYFTPGNIRDRSEDLRLYSDAYLDRNPRFIEVISRFHRAMRAGGRMLLTLYKDVPEAAAAQIDFYEHTGQQVVTSTGSRFVATAQGFWSTRWTRDSLLSNLDACGIHPDAVTWNDLNDIAWLVEVVK